MFNSDYSEKQRKIFLFSESYLIGSDYCFFMVIRPVGVTYLERNSIDQYVILYRIKANHPKGHLLLNT